VRSWSTFYLIVAVSGFLTSAIGTRALIWLAPRVGLIDHPDDQKYHRIPTPVGGGLAVFCALLPLLLTRLVHLPHTTLLLSCSGLLALIGLVDDFRRVSALVKFGMLVALTGLLWSYGVGVTISGVPALDFVITVIWVVGVSSAFNAIDNMDGLAPGVAAIAALGFLVIALQTGQWALGGLSAALGGACVGFLIFNVHPARIFLGDTGSFFIGFLLAALGILGDWNDNQLIAAIIPILLLGLPIFDLSFTVLRRHMSGVTRTPIEAIRHCATDHLSHRLVRLGLSTRAAVLLLYLISASFVLSAISLRNARSAEGILHLLQAVVIVAALVPVLCLADEPGHGARPGLARSLAWLVGLLGVGGLIVVLLVRAPI